MPQGSLRNGWTLMDWTTGTRSSLPGYNHSCPEEKKADVDDRIGNRLSSSSLELVLGPKGNGVTKKKDLSQSQVQRLVGKPFNSSQSLDSHECETVATDPAYQSSAAYSSGTKPRFLWIQSCGKIHIYFRAIQLVVSPGNPWDTSESVLKSPKNWVHEALDTPSWASLDAPTPNKLLVGIVKLSLFGHKDNSSYLIRSGAAGPGVTRDW
ncbi:unnamed protein product [Vicia faba]|uniref:Uncharacterized protein n=1 Tax=Vicia faba TaxID=3906 RepID=A0AAV1ADT0_VICFA|nr:unnamed protein product [Vicia faba]